jgi:hypothetical protein
MAKQLAALLGGVDIQRLAELVRQHGRGKDTVLAHITPREAEMLKANGGSGAINPMTGLPEFQEDPENYGFGYEGAPFSMPVSTPDIQQGFTYDTYEAPSASPGFEPAMQTQGFTYDTFEPIAAPQRLPSDMGIPDVRYYDAKQMQMDFPASEEPRSMQERIMGGAKQVLGTREGLAGLGTAAAIYQARQAGQQARRMQNELAAIGAPQRALGQQMIAAGQRGEITPVQRQQLEALAARERQQLAQRGLTSGTAAQQAQAQAVMREQRAAQDVLDQGLKIAGIGDQYQAAAIKAGYAADQATRDMLNTTLTNLYRTIYGTTTTPVTTSTTATVPGKG